MQTRALASPFSLFCFVLFCLSLAFLLGRNDELDMRGMNEDDLMTLCALSGCDYLPSVHGIGLKKAHRLVSRHKEVRTLPYLTVPYHSIQYRTISYHAIPYHTIPYRISIPYNTTPYHTIPYHTIPYLHTIQYHTIPYHTIPYIIQHHTVP